MAGPRILALAPIWAMGAWIACDPRLRISNAAAGLILVIVTWIAIFAFNASGIDGRVQDFMYAEVSWWWRLGSSQKTMTDHIVGLLVVLNFVGFRACAHWFGSALQRFAATIRFLAASTFSLYLFHRPMTKLLGAHGTSAGDNTLYATGLLLLIVTSCFALAEITEKRRLSARQLLSRWWPRKPVCPAVP